MIHPVANDESHVWEVELAASDYGIEDGYTLELQALLLRERHILATYFTTQSVKQPPGSGRELTVGPEQLAVLAQRATRDLLVQIAQDADRIRGLKGP